MSHYYSETTKGFYVEELRDLYEQAGTWPADARILTVEQYNKLHEELTGKHQVAFDKKGKPRVVPIPAADIKVLDSYAERSWRNDELSRADNMIKIVEDGEGVGTVEDWREYRKSLRKWPEHKSFPNMKFRPTAPDAEVKDA